MRSGSGWQQCRTAPALTSPTSQQAQATWRLLGWGELPVHPLPGGTLHPTSIAFLRNTTRSKVFPLPFSNAAAVAIQLQVFVLFKGQARLQPDFVNSLPPTHTQYGCFSIPPAKNISDSFQELLHTNCRTGKNDSEQLR